MLNINRSLTSRIILAISDRVNYVSAIYKKTDSTFSCVVRIIQRLEKEGFVVSEKIGRKKFIELTDKGKRLQELLREINSL